MDSFTEFRRLWNEAKAHGFGTKETVSILTKNGSYLADDFQALMTEIYLFNRGKITARILLKDIVEVG
jgi:hypothetical protein